MSSHIDELSLASQKPLINTLDNGEVHDRPVGSESV